ncbi:brassinosteroid LRR receptor kinase BRL2-like [Papaver somniferum]|uniref:brassinosteroid LRR receptor kinase BRL2-like n=1 Tax=Papaver somniferum TaxID=3469 RepID=UPI000E6F718B|nr:brassinosteroid LRR receptor kinase BRL2-like [Papaver somniferum]
MENAPVGVGECACEKDMESAPKEDMESALKRQGTIPTSIGYCMALESLDLGNNNLTGNVPNELGQLLLGSLDLSSNILSGPIPQSLTSLHFLGVLNLSYNKLSGRIPREAHFDTLSANGWAYSGNDLLCGELTEKVCDVIGLFGKILLKKSMKRMQMREYCFTELLFW